MSENIFPEEIIPITTQQVVAQIKLSGVQGAKSAGPSQTALGIPRNRQLPSNRGRMGWQCKAIDRTGMYARKYDGKVMYPAEAVEVNYGTRGYSHRLERAEQEKVILHEQLKRAGFSVMPHPRYPNAKTLFLVYRKA